MMPEIISEYQKKNLTVSNYCAKLMLKANLTVRNANMVLRKDIVMALTTDMCVIRLGKGESISNELAEILDEVDIASIHSFVVPLERPTELHYHDFDEYWLFTEGSTTVTLRLPDGTTKEYEIRPYELIATPKGVEHGHVPNETVKGFEFVSKIRNGIRHGHLYR